MYGIAQMQRYTYVYVHVPLHECIVLACIREDTHVLGIVHMCQPTCVQYTCDG